MSEFLVFGVWANFSADADVFSSVSFVFFSDVAGPVANEDTDEKILPYCDISKKSKKSLGEMEQEFLEALQVPTMFTTWRIHYITLCLTALLCCDHTNASYITDYHLTLKSPISVGYHMELHGITLLR